MGAKKSEEMKMARDLVIRQGKSGYAAAKLAGISQSAISQDPEIRKYREEKKANAAKTS